MELYVQIQRKNRNQKSQKTKQMLKIYWIASGHIRSLYFTPVLKGWKMINILVK